MNLNLLSLWQQTSLAGKAVLITLFLMGVVVLTLLLERSFMFWRDRRRARQLLRALQPLLQGAVSEERLQEAWKQIQASPPGSLRNMLFGLLQTALQQTAPTNGGSTNAWMERLERLEELERTLDKTRDREAKGLKRGLPSLATIASSAPFVGLLGTVIGIIHVFSTMKISGAGGINAIAGGIGEALITTAVGLVVAIPAGAAFNLFTSSVEKTIAAGDEIGNEMILTLMHTVDRASRKAS